MKINIKRTPQALLSVKILCIVGISFLLYLIINLVYLRLALNKDVQDILKNQNTRIINDLEYKNGKWDTSFYVNDSQIPQNNPLYVLTTDGFVIDRESPIKGFLDSSDFKYSSSFQQTQTITTPANETWRMYSKTINNQSGTPIGTVTAGWYRPEPESLNDVDNQLRNSVNIITSETKANGDSLDTNNVDVKKISVFVSFEVVDKFNHALVSVGGLPAYIDRSSFPPVIKTQYKTVSDTNTGEQFLVYSSPFMASGSPVGAVVSGYSLKQINKDFRNQFVFSVGTGAIVIVILIILLGFLLQRDIASLLKKAGETAQKVFYVSHRAGAFGFDQDTGLLYLGEKKMEVPVKTKQYYICKVLFSRPNKNWENDEIMDRLPEHALETEALDTYESLDGNDLRKKARMIYDAIRLLNEKAKKVFGYEVILIQGKTYRINPNIQSQNG